MVPLRPTTPRPDRQPSPLTVENPADRAVTPAPPEWSSYDAPINFTWVIPDELCGMGWPKSRDQVGKITFNKGQGLEIGHLFCVFHQTSRRPLIHILMPFQL
jgi:hypothetical protein